MTAQQNLDEARQFAHLLARFCRCQADKTLEQVPQDAECLDLAAMMIRVVNAQHLGSVAIKSSRGRKQSHDREWAQSCLWDLVMNDPDGMPASQVKLVDALRSRFEACGRKIPGDTWLKRMVLQFKMQATKFETEALQAFRRSAKLQMIFGTEASFMGFRRARSGLLQRWSQSPQLQSQFKTADGFITAAISGELID